VSAFSPVNLATVPIPYNGRGSNAEMLRIGAFMGGSCLSFVQLYAPTQSLDRRNSHFV
jgi:hypothetical protein